MRATHSLSHNIPISILLITVSSVNQWTNLPIGNTFIWWFIYGIILISFISSKKYYFDVSNQKNIKIALLFLLWNIICIVRGCLIAENYWEWKSLVGTGMVMLLPLSLYVTTNKILIQKIFKVWIKYALPAFFLFYLSFKYADASGRYLVPISFLLLFFPILRFKWKLIVIIFCVFVFMGNLSARSNIIKFSVPFLLSFIYYFPLNIIANIIKYLRLVFLVLPCVLFFLSITGVFNIFKMDEYVQGDFTINVNSDGKNKIEDLTSDTRTGIYMEVITSALKHDYVLFGRTPARGYESESFGLYALEKLKTGKMERFSNEVSILNVFTWTGIIGVILYFLVFFSASRIAIYKSNNIFLKIIGLYISFRWAYAWVEDFSNFDLSNFILWAMIGMCFSKAFREMNNQEMRYWVMGIFEKKYSRPIRNTQVPLSSQSEVHENYSSLTHLPQS